MSIRERIAQLGLSLPEPPSPRGNYVPFKIINLASVSGPSDWAENLPVVNSLLYLSGMIPLQDGEPFRTGKLGADVSMEDGVTCAQICTLNALGWARHALEGDLDRIIEVVQVRGFVASAVDFYDQPRVINGCSDMLVNIFGDDGKHVRSVVGSASLPLNVPVEIDYVFSLR
jgi:enamine deaminase RidA (YjgF/YER057c/UK114 family)